MERPRELSANSARVISPLTALETPANERLSEACTSTAEDRPALLDCSTLLMEVAVDTSTVTLREISLDSEAATTTIEPASEAWAELAEAVCVLRAPAVHVEMEASAVRARDTSLVMRTPRLASVLVARETSMPTLPNRVEL